MGAYTQQGDLQRPSVAQPLRQICTFDLAKNMHFWSGEKYALLVRRKICTFGPTKNMHFWSGEKYALLVRRKTCTFGREVDFYRTDSLLPPAFLSALGVRPGLVLAQPVRGLATTKGNGDCQCSSKWQDLRKGPPPGSRAWLAGQWQG
jgi:hypothetical protein